MLPVYLLLPVWPWTFKAHTDTSGNDWVCTQARSFHLLVLACCSLLWVQMHPALPPFKISPEKKCTLLQMNKTQMYSWSMLSFPFFHLANWPPPSRASESEQMPSFWGASSLAATMCPLGLHCVLRYPTTCTRATAIRYNYINTKMLLHQHLLIHRFRYSSLHIYTVIPFNCSPLSYHSFKRFLVLECKVPAFVFCCLSKTQSTPKNH